MYLILSSQIFQELLSDIFPSASFCFWFLLIAIILTPPMWLGSPKDFSWVNASKNVSDGLYVFFLL